MHKFIVAGASAIAFIVPGIAQAADANFSTPAPTKAYAVCDPYKNYSCLDTYLGSDPLTRFLRYYQLEWGHASAPADPKAPPSRIADWPATPQSTPPMPFTEWPYGGNTAAGVTRPSSIDSPFMTAIANTSPGQWMADNHIQIYGWVNPGGNLSTSSVKPGGNYPAAYAFTPNTIQLDQAVIYVERLPDTVQTDHVDWGFRISGIYGENYRYTTAYGLFSNQLLKNNSYNGYDMPMLYADVYIPQILSGLNIRIGRYISIPDTEAQLAPNNYMYSHSMTYAFDNYTNTGILATLNVTKNLVAQLGLEVGTEAMPWHIGQTIPNLYPSVINPGATMLKDPGAQPTLAAAVRYTTSSGNDAIYLVADGINNGQWGYNNLQWLGGTYYHKFNDEWHITFESYTLSQRNVLNANNTTAAAIYANGGSFASTQYLPYNGPFLAQCPAEVITCTARVYTALSYLNWKFTPLDNLSFRAEFYDDEEGQRTGTKTRYLETGIGWQHWYSPQIEVRPEVAYYRSFDAPAFNGNFNAATPIAPTKWWEVVASADVIVHF